MNASPRIPVPAVGFMTPGDIYAYCDDEAKPEAMKLAARQVPSMSFST
jgi:hypothetical protein